jgi:hypothetical protein
LRMGFWPGKALVRPFITKLYWAAMGSRMSFGRVLESWCAR